MFLLILAPIFHKKSQEKEFFFKDQVILRLTDFNQIGVEIKRT